MRVHATCEHGGREFLLFQRPNNEPTTADPIRDTLLALPNTGTLHAAIAGRRPEGDVCHD